MLSSELLILGAGHAGVQVAANLRQAQWQGSITLIDNGTEYPYERPPLSKEVLNGDTTQTFSLRKPQFYEDNRIELRLNSTVTQILPEQRKVRFQNGQEYGYNTLVIATGARARKLLIPGAQLPGVLSLRTREESEQLSAALIPGKRVVIVGAGYIGMEVAAAAISAGCSVTVIEFQDRIMSRVTSPVVSEFFTELHQKQGVEFFFNESVSEFLGDTQLEAVLTASGKRFEADLVVVGVGIVPNDELARDAGITTQDGILVDHQGRTSHPNIFAAGDVSKFDYVLDGSTIRLECIQNAVQQAQQISRALSGNCEEVPAEVPWFWTVQHGVRLQTAGLWRPTDQIVVRKHPKPHSFSVLYLREGKLAAIDTVNALGDFTQAKKLIAQGRIINPERASDVRNKLNDAAELITVG
ncbi:MAG: FAD-dependent oxidoreductase [Microbacteriaceae bacterium]